MEANTNDEILPDLWVAYRTIAGYQYLFVDNRSTSTSTYRFKFKTNKKNAKDGLVPAEEIKGKTKWQCDIAPGTTKCYVAGTNLDSIEGFVEYEYEEV